MPLFIEADDNLFSSFHIIGVVVMCVLSWKHNYSAH